MPIPILRSTEPSTRTEAQVREYVHEKYMTGAPDAEVDRVMSFYPDGNRFLGSYLCYR